MALSWEGGSKLYISGPDHMTKMAALPIYGKNLKHILLQNLLSYDLELGMENYVLKLYKVYINDEPELTLTLRQCHILQKYFLYLQ